MQVQEEKTGFDGCLLYIDYGLIVPGENESNALADS